MPSVIDFRVDDVDALYPTLVDKVQTFVNADDDAVGQPLSAVPHQGSGDS